MQNSLHHHTPPASSTGSKLNVRSVFLDAGSPRQQSKAQNLAAIWSLAGSVIDSGSSFFSCGKQSEIRGGGMSFSWHLWPQFLFFSPKSCYPPLQKKVPPGSTWVTLQSFTLTFTLEVFRGSVQNARGVIQLSSGFIYICSGFVFFVFFYFSVWNFFFPHRFSVFRGMKNGSVGVFLRS